MSVDRNSKEFQDQVRKAKKVKHIILGICVLAVVIAVIVQM